MPYIGIFVSCLVFYLGVYKTKDTGSYLVGFVLGAVVMTILILTLV
jgi:riboflavin transporter FmnP